MRVRMLGLLAALLLPAALALSSTADPGLPDTVRVDLNDLSRLCMPADSLAIKVYLWSDEVISGFSVGIVLDWGPFYVLGLSKEGSILPPGPEPTCICPPLIDSNKACIGWIDLPGTNGLQPTGGAAGRLLVTVYVRALGNAAYYGIKADTQFIPPACSFTFATQDGKSFIPQFASSPVFCDRVVEPEVGGQGQRPVTQCILQNYPNPFNGTTAIDIEIPTAGKVSLEIINIAGQKVRTLRDGYAPRGALHAAWDGTDDSGRIMPSGTYFCRLRIDDQILTRKIVLLK